MSATANVVVSTRNVFQGKLISVRVEEIRRDDGRMSTRELVDHQPSAVIVPYLEKSDEIIFIEQYRDAARKVLLELPAGMIPTESTPEETAQRELLEETGYRASHLRPLGNYYTSPGFTNEMHYCYLATGLVRVSGIQDINEIGDIKLMSRVDVLRQLEQGEFTDGKTMLGLFRAARYLPAKRKWGLF
ncbi:MAG TPA: NUDIX hydrolase [Ktedonobacterales bacterium]|nr:NUDIX hydrolase [Ktedonobacterales bacterium]